MIYFYHYGYIYESSLISVSQLPVIQVFSNQSTTFSGDMDGDAAAHPPLPWKARLKFAFLTAVSDAAVCKDGTVNRRLLNFFDPPTSPNPSPVHGVRTADFTLHTSTSPFLRVFVPAATAASSLPIVVFFHGGGFVFLSAASRIYDDVGRRLARELPAVVVSVDYCLAPVHKFPAAYDDATAALRWLDRDPTCAGFAPRRRLLLRTAIP